ncbi:hypothetical protein TWF173_001437 [Orbilia oligospora]|nr:hypothetical protein TWF173_001437 [Orbilia oligospora]
MLDDIHPSLPTPAADENTYTLGSIGGHNVVIACLPKQTIGTTAAAKVVTQMQCTFAIKIGLLVGVGGGIPSKLKLGDVVVGTEWVQWDFGRVIQGGFQQTSKRNKPPNNLLMAISKLRALRRMDRAQSGGRYFKFAIDTFVKFHPSLWGSALLTPATARIRPARVRYGLIASGNRVIKDAECRDEIDRSLGGDVLCIEMEAAGLLNFPYIPIRGICDYADSKKNDDWQQYAAAAAAGVDDVSSIRFVTSPHPFDTIALIYCQDLYGFGRIPPSTAKTVTENFLCSSRITPLVAAPKNSDSRSLSGSGSVNEIIDPNF